MSRFVNQSFRAAGRLSARAMQSLSEAIRSQRLWVAPPLEMRETPMGTVLSVSDLGMGQPRIVKPTSITPNSYGYLSGKLQEFDPATGTWNDGQDCHIINAN